MPGAERLARRPDSDLVRARSRLTRERLSARLEQRHRVVLVVAPPGAGKTTVLAQLAADFGVATALYCPDAADGDGTVLLAGLRAALAGAGVMALSVWNTAADAVHDLGKVCADRRVVLVLDDLHILEDTPAEDVVETLALHGPPGLILLIASRRQPVINLSRLRLTGELLELDSDDLRFRSWEVERLFSEHYGERLGPEEIAEVARRTEGWAAGLQLFHLATREKPAGERRRILAGLSSRSRLVREYLAQNVIDDLPGDLRRFALESCVLGRLTGPLCDDAFGGVGSGLLLQELERRQIFLRRLDDGNTYRYHEVLRSYLEALLVDQVGEAAVRARHQAAAEALEKRGFLSDALRAYCRAEDWTAVSRVAAEATDGRRHGASDWVEAVPATLLREDPWLTLAAARHNVAAGRLDAAVELYTQAERGFGALHAGEKCREERAAVTAWVEPASEIPEGWIGTLRRVARDGTESVRPGLESLPWPGQGVVGAVCAALEGDFDRAVILLTAAADDPSASPALEAATRLAAGVVDAVAGRSDVLARLIAAQEAAERLQLPWLSHLGHVAIVAASQGVDGGAVRRLGTSRPTDPWPAALDELLDALWVPQGERRSSALEGAAARLEALGVPALAEWVITRECTPVRVPSPRVVVRCFGEFSLSVRGRPVSFTELRPRARALLRLLAVNAGRRLHREALLDALWPESDLAAGTRSLQVAVSSVRMLLDPIVGAQRSSIERDGEAYRLALPADSEIDVVRFETLLGEAQAAAARHDHTSERRALEAALDTYSGDLLAADGPSEWAIEERDRLRILAADTAYYLAAGHLEQDEPHAAMSAAQRGIAIDKYRDGLWRILISAQERQGDVAAAARSCRAYDAMLGELGLGSADMSA